LIYSLYKNEYKNLKLAETTIRKELSRMKKRRRTKSGYKTYIHGNTQENSLCSYLYIKEAKTSCFSFFFYKIGEQEGGTGPWGGAGFQGKWGDGWEGGKEG
jgi:hypothetical protein